MSISFQTNLASMIAQNNLNANNQFQTQTITQLTSGYRINSSGDDAAGLAVANQYRSNIAELNQGVLNGNNGVSTLQIIDGGLSNISTMLDRMKTLATESASTTFTGNRATLDTEYQTLLGEINREAGNIGLGTSNATYATQLSVYIGGGQSSSSGSQVNIDLGNGKVDAAALGLTGTNVAANSPVTVGSAAAVAATAPETFTVNTASGSSSFVITPETNDTVATQLARLNTDLGTVGIAASLDSTGNLAFSSNGAFSVAITGAGLGAGTEVGLDNTDLNNQTLTYDNTGAAGQFTLTEGTTNATVSLAGGLSATQAVASLNAQLQAGGITDVTAILDTAAGGNTISLQSASAFTLTPAATNGVVAATYAPATGAGGALSAINAINAAVQSLGTVQGVVGAGENKLNYAIGLANSQITNYSSAQSQIRDADIATEAANLTKAQVLEQASVAAMAQANSSPQAILSLLKG
jgi:flagellin